MATIPESECRLTARMARLSEATAWLDDWCTGHGVGNTDRLRLTLLVEELFTNTVRHGHGGDCDAPVHLSLNAGLACIVLEYADRARPFDPSNAAGSAVAGAATQVGGLGLLLLSKLARRAVYVRDEGWNRLRLELERTATAVP